MEYDQISDVTEITEDEVKRLISLEKIPTSNQQITYPSAGETIDIQLTSMDKIEMFVLSVGVGRIDLLKTSNQLRIKTGNIPLVRIDTGNIQHKNPDGTIIAEPHIHIYKEGYGIRFAYPISDYLETNPNDPWQVLQDFMDYCKIIIKPCIIKGVDQW